MTLFYIVKHALVRHPQLTWKAQKFRKLSFTRIASSFLNILPYLINHRPLPATGKIEVSLRFCRCASR